MYSVVVIIMKMVIYVYLMLLSNIVNIGDVIVVIKEYWWGKVRNENFKLFNLLCVGIYLRKWIK